MAESQRCLRSHAARFLCILKPAVSTTILSLYDSYYHNWYWVIQDSKLVSTAADFLFYLFLTGLGKVNIRGISPFSFLPKWRQYHWAICFITSPSQKWAVCSFYRIILTGFSMQMESAPNCLNSNVSKSSSNLLNLKNYIPYPALGESLSLSLSCFRLVSYIIPFIILLSSDSLFPKNNFSKCWVEI